MRILLLAFLIFAAVVTAYDANRARSEVARLELRYATEQKETKQQIEKTLLLVRDLETAAVALCQRADASEGNLHNLVGTIAPALVGLNAYMRDAARQASEISHWPPPEINVTLTELEETSAQVRDLRTLDRRQSAVHRR